MARRSRDCFEPMLLQIDVPASYFIFSKQKYWLFKAPFRGHDLE
jgi:hypothetical protein